MAAAAATVSSSDAFGLEVFMVEDGPEHDAFVDALEEVFRSALADEIHEVGKTPDRLFMETMLSIPGVTRDDGTIDYRAIGHDWKSEVSKTEDGRKYLQIYLFNTIKCADTLIRACEISIQSLGDDRLYTPMKIGDVHYGGVHRGGIDGGYIVPVTTAHGKGHFSLERIPSGDVKEYELEPLTRFLRLGSFGTLSSGLMKDQDRLFVAIDGLFAGSLVIQSGYDDDVYWIFHPGRTMVRALERGGYLKTDLPKLLTK
jgi:hypothetical protein